MADPLLASIIRAIAEDAEALGLLRDVVGVAAPAPPNPAPAYTVASLAGAIGVSQKMIRNAIARGELDAVKRGGRWLISLDAVAIWLGPTRATGRRPALSPLADAMRRIDQPRKRA